MTTTRRLSTLCTATSGLTAAVLAATLLPADAADRDGKATADISVSADSCIASGDSTRTRTVEGWEASRGPVSASASSAVRFADPGDAADVIEVKGSVDVGAARVDRADGSTVITGTASASGTTTPSRVEAACAVDSFVFGTVNGHIEVTSPRWVTITGSGDGDGDGDGRTIAHASLGADEITALAVHVGRRSSGRAEGLIPAGAHQFEMTSGTALFNAQQSSHVAYGGRFSILLQPLGAASKATGNAGLLVKLRKRACATGAINAVITPRGARNARKLVVTVNGERRAAFARKRLRARTFTVPAPRTAKAQVTATVTTKAGTIRRLSRSYLPCA